MQRMEKVTIAKMGIAGGLAIVVIVAFSIPFGMIPPLGNFLLPGGDVWTAPGEVPVYEEMTIPGLSGDVRVYRDQWGIPHIYGTGESDLIFALGYVHAQDRLFQMDMARRQTRGQLSEILGDDYIATDKYNLLMGKEYWANETLKVMETSSDLVIENIYHLLLRYAEGVNFYIQGHPNLPIEFGFLNYAPRAWLPLDTLCFAKYMAEMLTWGYDDLGRMNATAGLGGINYTELFGNPQPFQIPICPGYGNYSDITVPLGVGSPGEVPFGVRSAFGSFMDQVTTIPQEVERITQGPEIGSNNWVVNGSHTSTGKPILCNDMHLGWNLPGIWYEAHLVDITPSSNYNFYGFFLAGVPVPIVGHNADVGWGYTNTGYDVLDWYYYTPVDTGHYWYKGVSTAYQTRTVTINVKGSTPVQYEIKSTVHGPVMSDVVPNLAGTGMQNLPIACKWTAQNVTYEFLALYNMSHAKNRNEFSNATKAFHVPAQNMIYADIDGTIGIRPTGLVPIRNDSALLPENILWHTGNGTMPYNGSAGEGEWTSYVEFDDLPYSDNPDQGFLVSANQIVAGPTYLQQRSLQSDYDSGYRARRINSLISSKIKTGPISISDMQRFQLDVFNVLAERLTPILLETLDFMVASKSSIQQAAYNALSGWDYNMDKEGVAPTIFSVWSEAYREETFKDEMTTYQSPLTPSFAVLENLTLNTTNSPWFDNISTAGLEDRNVTLVTAFNKTLAALYTSFNAADVSTWKWGQIHQVSFPHITGLSSLGAGPYPSNGTSYTVSPSWATNYHDGKVSVGTARGGASERLIVDFADLNRTLSVIPSGQRGISTSKHYRDQLDMFLAGQYHLQYFAANTLAAWSSAWTESSILFKKGGA